MRILHIYHGGLPAIRVEKMAHSMKRKGHELVFLGQKAEGQHINVFDSAHTLSLGNSLRIVVDPNIKLNWIRKIQQIDPDIIHAHNCVVGHFVLSTKYPAVFDDHEYYSKQKSRYNVRPFIKRMAVKPMTLLFPKWEKKLIERYPTLTTHRNMTKEHRQKGDFVRTVSNVPLTKQVEDMDIDGPRRGNVYIGSDFKLKEFLPHRDLTGLADIIDFDVLTGLPYEEMMSTLTQYEVGLTPWHSHPWHRYSDANKNYEYLHAGLPVVTNSIIKNSLFQKNPYVFGFKEYFEIPKIIGGIPDFDRTRIKEQAMTSYVWENFENRIYDAYNEALK